MKDRNVGSAFFGERGGKVLRSLCLIGVVALAFLMSFHTLTGVDIFWHLKAGEIIWQTHEVPKQDLFSFTKAGAEWIDAQWLFQVVVYALHQSLGYPGMILFSACLAALTWALILGIGYQPKRYLLTTLIGIISLLAALSRLKLRPESFSFLFMALEIYLIHQHQRGKKFALYIVPVLIWLWAGSEGLWPLGLFILSAFLIEEIFFLPRLNMQKYFKRMFPPAPAGAASRLGICFILSALLTLANPYGLNGVLFPWRLFKEISFPESFLGGYIGEFQNPFLYLRWLDLSAYIILILFSAVVLGLALRQRRVSPAALLLWAGFLYLSAISLRNVALFAIVMAAVIGMALASEGSRGESINEEFFPSPRIRASFLQAQPFFAIGLLIIFFWLGLDITTSRFFIRNQSYVRFGVGALETEFPVRASEFLKSISFPPDPLGKAKIFNDLKSAGYLIWSGHPEWRVYTDPRLEVYGENFFERYSYLFMNYRAFEREDQKYDFDAVVLSPLTRHKLFVRELYLDKKWALVYLDGLNVIFLKDKPSLSAAIQNHGIDIQNGLESDVPQELGRAWLARERLGRGSILLVLDQPEWALRELEEAARLDPRDINISFYLGWALRTLRRYHEARPYLERVAKKRPEFLPNRIELAEVYALVGETDRAIQEFQQILKRDPEQMHACIDLAKVYEKVRKHQAYAQWQICWEISLKNPERFPSEAVEIYHALKRLEELK
jgi:tetratricopeptide (TPR) repeat protein